ncbi:ANK3, partial [Symbiodinium pilosum]
PATRPEAGFSTVLEGESSPEAAKESAVHDDAAEVKPRLQGTPLLADVCRRMRQAAEQMFQAELAEQAPGGNVAWYLSKALERGLSCVVSPLPRFELNAVDPAEGTALHFACSRELGNAALALLACGDFDLSVPKVRERDGSTALHLAAASGLEAVVQALINRADFAEFMGIVDKDGFTALHGAAFRGHLGCVQALVRSPLVSEDIIAACGNFDVPRPHGHWALEAAEIYDMNTALHMAAATGRAEICQLLLIHGPSAANKVNRMGATALHMAAKGGFVSTVEALLASTCFNAVNARDARGFTALHWAAQQVHADICLAILGCQDFFQIESKDLRGRTAANIAEELQHFEVQRQILQRCRKPLD